MLSLLVNNFAFSQNSKDSIKQTIIQLIDDSESEWQANKPKSDSLIHVAFEIINNNNFNDSIIITEAYHVLGKNLIERNKYNEGIDTLKKCVRLKKKLHPNDFKSLSKSNNWIGIGFYKNKVYDSANYYYFKSVEPLIKNDIWDINVFYGYMNIGIGYANLGKYPIALEYFDTVLLVINKSGLKNDSSILSQYNYNYALFTTLTGKLNDANEYYEESATIYRDMYGDDYISLAGININKGINSYYAYELSKAQIYFNKALEVYSANNIKNDERIAKIYLNLSEISQTLGNFQASIKYSMLGLENQPNDDLKLLLFKSIANSYATTGKNKLADDYFRKALPMLNNTNINPKRKQSIYLSYAQFLSEVGFASYSLKYYRKALQSAYNLNGADSEQYGDVLIQLGTYYLDYEKIGDSAQYYYLKAKKIYENYNSDSRGDNLNIVNRKKADFGIGAVLLLKYQQSNDITYLYKADTIFSDVLYEMELISSKLSTANKLVLIELVNPVYLLAVENSFELYKKTNNKLYLEKVANFIERSKSAALLAEVNSENAIKTSDIPNETFENEHQMKDEINGLRQLLGNEKIKQSPDSIKVSFFESKLLKLLVNYDSLIMEIEAKYPKYYSAKYYNDVISLEEIQSKLESDEIILEYLLTNSVVYIMAVTNCEFDIKAIEIDSVFFNALNYIISIKNVKLNDQNLSTFNEFKKNSHELWKSLIKPQYNLIGSKRLIIIPDGLLGYLPFDILTEYDYESNKINYRDLPYLLRNNPISYSYSATIKFNSYFENNNTKNADDNILAFAPSYNSEQNKQESLSKLKFAKAEVLEIINSYEGKAFIDNKATKENFLSKSGSSKILHLAMHTIINDSLPLQSKLVFYNNNSDTISNYMFTHELYNMDINASMVTLSACNTGSGEFRKGEGIMSLARGFVYAGVPSIVMTLWEAQDATGAKLMKRYYANLFLGMKKDVALQNAKMSVLKDANMANSHPYFWSAYVINGDTSEIIVTEKTNYLYWIVVAGLIIAVFVGLQYRNRKSKKYRN